MKIAIIGSYSTKIFLMELEKLFSKGYTFYETEYSQIEHEVFNKKSGLHKFSPDYIFIHETSFNFKKNYVDTNNHKFYISKISSLKNLLNVLLESLPEVKVLYPLLENDNDMNFGNYFFKIAHSIDAQIHYYNYELAKLALDFKNLYPLDINNLIFHFGMPRDTRLFISADMHFSLPFTRALARNTANYIKSFEGVTIKCIILDLDNTLWGGVIGDDGISSIQIGGYGVGKAFSEFQSWLKSLKNRGVILCVYAQKMMKKMQENHLLIILK